MKRIFLSALIGVGMVALISPLFSGKSAARTSEDYPLVCRGGGIIVPGKAPGGNIGFTFTRGKRPAGEGLDPGVCSWVDRGMYDSEPNTVSQHVEEVVGTPENKWYDELRYSDKYWTFMVSNNGKGQLIATSARPGGGGDVSPATTTTFTASPEALKTWYVWHRWYNDRVNCEPPAVPYADRVPAGQILVGYINYYEGGSGPFPCEWNSKIDYRGTIWFDLSEIFKESTTPFVADKAILKFKKVEGSVAAYDGERRPITKVCEDQLFAANADSMTPVPEQPWSYAGNTHFPTSDLIAPINGCPPEGCSVDVTELVNKWIMGKINRYGLTIVGEDEDWLDKLIPHGKNVCETRYTDFSLTVTYRKLLLVVLPPDKKPIPPGRDLPEALCRNVALASNRAVATALTTFPGSEPSVVIDGDRRGAGKAGTWASATKDVPTWIEVDFNGNKSITEINVFTKQDDLASPVEPTETTTFSKYGLTEFEVQYWYRKFGTWVTIPGGHVSGNNLVWRQFKFPAITTSKIRILCLSSPDSYSRITEVEACGN